MTGEKMMCCANCGISAIDDVELMMRHDCDLVKYCSDECQNNHREQHVEECKKRKAELRDRDLFTMPDESHLGECPICCLPLPLDADKSTFMECCSKILCNGCHYGNTEREIEARLGHRRAFCREPLAETKEEGLKRCMKRIKENNDPDAICFMGKMRYHEGDYESAVNILQKQLSWEIHGRIMNYQLCIVRAKLWRRI